MNNEKKKVLLDAYIARATPMPTLPASAMRILELTRADDADVEKIADEIMKDKVLTARMIRLVNSAFWGIRRRVASIREAIVYLGLNQIRSIVLTTSLFNTFPSKNPAFNISYIWQHGLGCALISKKIASLVHYPDLEKVYLGGLMHDIGKVVLSQFSIKEYDEVLEMVKEGFSTFYEAENKLLGINHCDFGPWFSSQWGFSKELTETISLHHNPEEAREDISLVSIVSLANLFCRVRGLDYAIKQHNPVSMFDTPAWKILKGNDPKLEKLDLARFTWELDATVEEVRQVVKAVFQSHQAVETA